MVPDQVKHLWKPYQIMKMAVQSIGSNGGLARTIRIGPKTMEAQTRPAPDDDNPHATGQRTYLEVIEDIMIAAHNVGHTEVADFIADHINETRAYLHMENAQKELEVIEKIKGRGSVFEKMSNRISEVVCIGMFIPLLGIYLSWIH